MIKSNIFYLILFSNIIVVFYSILFFHYEGGDIDTYKVLYSLMAKSNFIDSFIYYKSLTSSIEPLYFIIAFSFSKLLSYFYFKLLITLLLYNLVFQLIYKFTNYSKIFYLVYLPILLLTNYYLIALSTELERLSIAVIFFVLFGITKNKILFLLSSISHFQFILFYISQFIFSIFYTFKAFKINFTSIFLLSIVAFLFYYFFNSVIISKLKFYYLSYDLNFGYGILVFIIFAIYCKSMYLFIIVLSFTLTGTVVGTSRLNIILLFVCFYFILEKKDNNFKHSILFILFLLTSIKGLYFISNVITTGRGYN